jgi:hypothetical protein
LFPVEVALHGPLHICFGFFPKGFAPRARTWLLRVDTRLEASDFSRFFYLCNKPRFLFRIEAAENCSEKYA